MVIVGCLILVFWMGILPILVGSIFAGKNRDYKNSIAFRFMAGSMILWAIFQLICVPCVILEKSFHVVVVGFLVATLPFLIWGCFCLYKNPVEIKRKCSFERIEKIGWIVFACLLVLQLVCSVVLTYADGDDAFYVAVSAITWDSDTMYQKSPYSTGLMGLDIRHGLAPFPIWIAFLSRISGIHTAIMAHTIVGTYLIAMSYMAFYLVGKQLFSKKEECIPFFLTMMALLVLFGDYSSRTLENFMIARSRQGKAAIGSIIIPMLLFLLLTILKKIQEERKIEFIMWLLLLGTVIAACLCTTLGTFLSCAMIGCVGICALLVYKKIMPVVKMAICCIPAVGFALLYFVLG